MRIVRFAALCGSLAVVGCGAGTAEGVPDFDAAGGDFTAPTQQAAVAPEEEAPPAPTFIVPDPARIERTRAVTTAQPAKPQLVVRGEHFDFAEGAPLIVMSGILSCGWMETGRGHAVVADGAFEGAMERQYPDFGYESLYLLVDADGDGVCDEAKGDTVFQAPFSLGEQSLTIDGAQLAPDEWSCMLFNMRPPPEAAP